MSLVRPHDPNHRPLRYRTCAALSWGVAQGFLGRHLTVTGRENVPAAGPLVVASNHLSNLDPMLFGGLFPETLHVLAKREMFRNRSLSWILTGCNCIPVDRGGADRRAVRAALDVLAGGGRLLIFVEGTRATARGMHEAESGVGFLIRRSGAPVIPVGIAGSERVWPRGRSRLYRADVRMAIGRPFNPVPSDQGRRDDQAVAVSVARAIARLLPLEYRGVYATPAG